MANKLKLVIDDVIYMHNEIFTSFGDITTIAGKDIDNKAVLDADVLIVRSRTKVDSELLQNSSVKFVGSAVSGTEHIDLEYLANNNITFAHAQGSNANAVVEYVIAALANIAADFNFNLATKTLAIIGVGHVGSRLNSYANKLGITTLLNDPIRKQVEGRDDFVSLDKALTADIISVHTPLTKDGKNPSYNLINKNNFHYINDKTIVINAARGGVIAEDIWQNTKTLANVIDCWQDEPNINKQLQQNAYWATPHIAGHSIDAKFMGSFMIYQALCQFLQIIPNKQVQNLLNPQPHAINTSNFKDSINAIYNFRDDIDATADNTKFEHYRRNYPKRYEWQHFKLPNYKL